MKNSSSQRMSVVERIRLIGFLCLFAPAAIAAPISYVFSGPASGTLGGTSFAGAQVTITGTADTANITTTGGLAAVPCVDLTSVAINIAGVGSADITVPTSFFDNHSVQRWGIDTSPCGATSLGDLLAVGNALAATYALSTSIGPVTGVQVSGTGVATTAGPLTLTAVPLTFQATLGAVSPVAVPMPTLSQWPLLALTVALGGIALLTLRRQTLSRHGS